MTYVKINWLQIAVTHNDMFRCLIKAISRHMELVVPSRVQLRIWCYGFQESEPLVALLYKHDKRWTSFDLPSVCAQSFTDFVNDSGISNRSIISINATELISIIRDCKVKL